MIDHWQNEASRLGYIVVSKKVADLMREQIRYQNDLIFQGLNNNLYGNNPGEIDRWIDDGGLCLDVD